MDAQIDVLVESRREDSQVTFAQPPQASRMRLDSPVTDDDQAVAVFAALGHNVRLRLWRLLLPYGAAGLPAGTIAAHMSIDPSRLSFHLRQMTQAGTLTQPTLDQVSTTLRLRRDRRYIRPRTDKRESQVSQHPSNPSLARLALPWQFKAAVQRLSAGLISVSDRSVRRGLALTEFARATKRQATDYPANHCRANSSAPSLGVDFYVGT